MEISRERRSSTKLSDWTGPTEEQGRTGESVERWMDDWLIARWLMARWQDSVGFRSVPCFEADVCIHRRKACLWSVMEELI